MGWSKYEFARLEHRIHERQKARGAAAVANVEALRGTAKPKRRTGWYRRSKATDRTEDGITFASKAELKRYRELKAAKGRGLVKWFIRQPVFDLAGVIYRADFLVVRDSGAIVIEDVKGRGGPRGSLDRFRRDREQVKAIHGVDVILVEMD